MKLAINFSIRKNPTRIALIVITSLFFTHLAMAREITTTCGIKVTSINANFSDGNKQVGGKLLTQYVYYDAFVSINVHPNTDIKKISKNYAAYMLRAFNNTVPKNLRHKFQYREDTSGGVIYYGKKLFYGNEIEQTAYGVYPHNPDLAPSVWRASNFYWVYFTRYRNHPNQLEVKMRLYDYQYYYKPIITDRLMSMVVCNILYRGLTAKYRTHINRRLKSN